MVWCRFESHCDVSVFVEDETVDLIAELSEQGKESGALFDGSLFDMVLSGGGLFDGALFVLVCLRTSHSECSHDHDEGGGECQWKWSPVP